MPAVNQMNKSGNSSSHFSGLRIQVANDIAMYSTHSTMHIMPIIGISTQYLVIVFQGANNAASVIAATKAPKNAGML